MTAPTNPRPAPALDPLLDDPDLSPEARVERLIAVALYDPAHRLRLEEELARGGMGTVRLAFDRTLQRRMAVKTLHAEAEGRLLLVHGFLREAQVTGQLDHPNIVPIHELGRDERGHLYFTMKVVDGESLHARIGRAPPASYEQLKERLEVFVKVCDALAFAHHRGVLHCDLKAANVMVGRYGQVYLMDWGGAQLLQPPPGVDTRSWVRDPLPSLGPLRGVILGTPGYMSPEQASAGRVPLDERSDIFSMGALLHELMTGRPPYTGGAAKDRLARAAKWDITAPEERPHLYPRELIRIAMTAMAKHPADRYRSVEELQTAIAGVLGGGGNFPTMRVPAGVRVICEGEVGDAAYWIESGTFEVYQTRDGVRTALRTLTRNMFFGETAIFAHTTRTASVVAVTDGVLKVFTAAALEAQLDTMAPWMRALIETMAKYFAGQGPARRAAAIEIQQVSRTEMVLEPEASASEFETTQVASSPASIDSVDPSMISIEVSDLADGDEAPPPPPPAKPTKPTRSAG